MSADLGTETKRESEAETQRDVIEVTPEEVDAAEEAATASSTEGAGTTPTAEPGPQQPAEKPQLDDSAKTVYCVRCGSDMQPSDRFCRNCGWDSNSTAGAPAPPRPREPLPPNTSDRNRLTTLLLCVLLGWLGAHRFYLGKAGTGILWLLTFGLLGIGVVFDLVMIATGECRDIEGRPVLRWE